MDGEAAFVSRQFIEDLPSNYNTEKWLPSVVH
jgi:hypothetical protein